MKKSLVIVLSALAFVMGTYTVSAGETNSPVVVKKEKKHGKKKHGKKKRKAAHKAAPAAPDAGMPPAEGTPAGN